MTDTNIETYSIDELLAIFNLTEPTIFNVKDKAHSLIAKMTNENRPELKIFFEQARDKIIESLKHNDYIDEEEKESGDVWGKEHFIDDKPKPKINVQPIISTSIIIIDSQYRTNIMPYANNPLSNAFNTSFIFNLTNPIYKVVSLKLYSYQIPTSWYAFNSFAGNTFFMYNGIIINIPDGNYSPVTLVETINTIAQQNLATSSLLVTYDNTTNKISLKNTDLLSDNITVIFFIQSNVVNFNNCGQFVLSNFQTLGINTTLGWLIGFRTTPGVTGDVAITLNGGQTVVADVPPNTYGPKYFVLSLEEFSNQRLTSGLYNITKTKKDASISVTDYFKTVNVACKLQSGSLTQAQQYAINEITANSTANNNLVGFNNQLSGPNAGAAFATIPLSGISSLRPEPYVKFGSDLVINVRKYNKPINLQRIAVSLNDDKGNLVNLYDNDWSFSLLVEVSLN